MLVFVIYVLVGCSIWMLVYAYLMWSLPRIPRLHQQVAGVVMPTEWPMLSVIIPACNEGEHIESALNSILRQDYPNLEIIVIDDRSTDATGAIIDRLGALDTRIKPIHITTLPEGWLGKVNALHHGVQHARGDWLLFTDADIHFATGTLQRAITYAQYTQADHLALLPRVLLNTFWLGVAVRSFGLLFLLMTRAAHVHRADNNYYIGVGAFNLIRRSTFDQTPGFDWLRLEPGDDAALGMLVKQAGGRSRFARAEDELTVSWYPSLPAMFKGLEKNLFGPGAHYQWWRVVFQVTGACALVAAPMLGLCVGLSTDTPSLLLAAGCAMGVHLVFAWLYAENKPIDNVYLLLFPLGFLLINAMMVRAAYQCLRNDGIDWRGTHYSLTQLRRGQRIKF